MKKIITLEEAIRTCVIKEGDLINPEEIFEQNNQILTLTPIETGWEENQVFSNEQLTWFYFKDQEENIKICGYQTKQKLILKGMKGYLGGVLCITKICELYSNSDLVFTAKPATVQDIKFLSNSKKFIDFFNSTDCWLGDSYNADDLNYGLRTIYKGGLDYKGLYFPLSSSKISSGKNGICPILSISLPSKVLVDLESKEKEGAWRLILKNKC